MCAFNMFKTPFPHNTTTVTVYHFKPTFSAQCVDKWTPAARALKEPERDRVMSGVDMALCPVSSLLESGHNKNRAGQSDAIAARAHTPHFHFITRVWSTVSCCDMQTHSPVFNTTAQMLSPLFI